MKLNKIVLLLTVALVATLAASGCKKGFSGKVTNLPGPQPLVSDQGGGPTISDTKPFSDQNPPPTFNDKPEKIAQNQPWDVSQVTQDRDVFANQTVHFAFDSAAVLSKEQDKLIIVSEKLKSDANALLLIEGHCDERGTEEYNRALGERRALALREALAAAGIDPQRIRTISYGKDHPADTGHDEAAWTKNRRGEFILCHLKTGA